MSFVQCHNSRAGTIPGDHDAEPQTEAYLAAHRAAVPAVRPCNAASIYRVGAPADADVVCKRNASPDALL